MNDSHLTSITQIREFLKFSGVIEFSGASLKEKYLWLDTVLNRFNYFKLCKKDKGVVKSYVMKMTNISDAQLGRLIKKKRQIGKIIASSKRRHSFPTIYNSNDIALLIRTDNAHERMSGLATREIFKREHDVYGKTEYCRLKDISSSHIYNLRGRRQYMSASLTYTKTQATQVNLVERRKPFPDNKPGYIRVDSVHQGDLNKEKGVYHINMVDEVAQWEIVGAVEKISEQYLEVLLEDLIKQFPFKIINFHSDNGNEYINKTVVKLMNKLMISQTKSRSGHCNDQALVECKNGAVIRKHMGRMHISQKYAEPINEFYRNYFNPYINYHRPSSYPTIIYDANGKRRKKYKTYLTPFEKLKTIENVEQYLKNEINIEKLEKIAKEKSDNEYAALMQEKKSQLFKTFNS
jgi:transposase InsO family protein